MALGPAIVEQIHQRVAAFAQGRRIVPGARGHPGLYRDLGGMEGNFLSQQLQTLDVRNSPPLVHAVEATATDVDDSDHSWAVGQQLVLVDPLKGGVSLFAAEHDESVRVQDAGEPQKIVRAEDLFSRRFAARVIQAPPQGLRPGVGDRDPPTAQRRRLDATFPEKVALSRHLPQLREQMRQVVAGGASGRATVPGLFLARARKDERHLAAGRMLEIWRGARERAPSLESKSLKL